jgi:hypothetical protein
MVTAAAGLAVATAGPAAAKPYPPPSIHLLCTAAADDGTLEGSVCVLRPGVTTAPNSYSATVAVSKAGSAGATVTFALTAGSLPPGLTMAAQSAGPAPPSPETPPGPPDQLLCGPADNGGFLISGTCVLPDAEIGQPYQGHLVTSHKVAGSSPSPSSPERRGLTAAS